MKSVKVVALLLALAMIFVFAGCKSSAKPAPAIGLDTTAKVETIEHKGSAFGIKDLPQWLSEYLQRNGTISVEALPDFKGMYVVIGQANAVGQQQAETWAERFDAQQQVGATINTRVASIFKAHENLLPDEPDAKRKYDNALNTLVTASYTGLAKKADWWVHQKITEKKQEPVTRYTSFALFTIEKTFLNQQIRDQIAKLKEDSDPEFDAFFSAITQQLLEKGLEWE